jgi:serine/threonine-protein kinase
MEYVEGSTLREMIHRGLEVGDAVEIARQLLTGVEFAHKHGIVHRDLKPANVLVDHTGRVRVADFGIARGTAGSEITETGSVMGTAEYFSPEQAQGRPVTAQSDLYSVGVILYEMLTGSPPFTGENTVAVAMKHVTERPDPPSALNPSVSRALDNVVLAALAKEPANRPHDAAELRRSLDAAEDNPGGFGAATTTHTQIAPQIPLPPPSSPPTIPPEEPPADRRKLIWGTVVALLLGILGAAAVVALLGAEQVVVPAVISKTENAATRQLQQAGFNVDSVRVPNSAKAGTVVETDPPAGTTADKGSTVLLSVSDGPSEEPVPDVAGQTERRARQILEDAGFEVKTRLRFDSEVKSGRAIGTDPSRGTRVAVGQTVILLISKGTEVVTVPDVVGKVEGIARQELEDAGFIVNADQVESDAPSGEVVEQSPAGGTQRPTDTRVTILVSSGSSTTTLPDVVGLNRDRAVQRLVRAGFEVQTFDQATDSPERDEMVVRQTPAGGSDVAPGSLITLVVAVYTEPTPDPGTGAGTQLDPGSAASLRPR